MKWIHRVVEFAAWFAAVLPTCVLAQEAEAEGTKEAWVVSYAIVVLSIGLAVYIISKPARREK